MMGGVGGEENLILVALHKITLKWGYFERIQRDFLYTIASSSKKCKLVFAKPKIEQISYYVYCASNSINSCLIMTFEIGALFQLVPYL